ncbi:MULTISPECIES: DUF2249 domain-containing protein [Streptomyces]|uniref:DUF2249 domain-containing protein n=1 Tax=Streptomyces coelicoflavus TaxID=285562 RepID=A0A6N9UBH0_9ACTN|nr:MULTISPECIES: DUF2249 domain-containing protein [Streptomyces]EHN79186.1 hypothetical protein SMCF_1250 [Streptomyces coelicoflavus ZG0656]KPC86695.1 hypothetical protein ADL35_10625 [Streptomyces sp. NRRL WC-3753]MZE48579.1 DUF2249 domain-containing protein [Streptomyces sp. SID5477]NEB15128.1 DUF2249 domain-containing protein [Streptomyces coelicoflavus]OWA01353.1 hypothetical protein B9W64_35615 [Streptomyces sp. CS159]
MAPAADVYIQATDTDPDIQAQAVVEEAHRKVLEALAALTGSEPAAETGTGFAVQLRDLLTATDQTLYAAASGAAETRLLVRALRAAADTIGRHADSLTAATDGGEPSGAVRVLEGMLTVHVGMERAVLLPALAALPGVDLSALVGDFTTVLEGGRLEDPEIVDVREIPHGQRHPRIFTRFARLAAEESFVLVNNHDPKPLRREFEATHPGRFTWEYVESGPERWQVRITRVG